jgi:outer membrane protein assembly factor BamB
MTHPVRSTLVAALAASLLLFAAGCDKGKKAEPPAELVDLKPTLQVARLWDTRIGGGEPVLRLGLGIALADDVLYAAGRDGQVEALDANTGKARWSTDTRKALSAGPAAGPGLVVVASSDGEVIALDAAKGSRVWKVDVAGEVLAAPLVTAERVFVRTVDARLRALDAATGAELWTAEESMPRLTLRGTATPALAGDNVIVGFDSGKVVAFAAATGEVAWQAQVTMPRGRSELERLADVDGSISIDGDDGYAVGYQGRVVMFALDSGQVWWGRDLSSYRGVALDDSQLYVSTSDGSVAALRRRDGTVQWQQDGLRLRGLSTPAVVGNAVVVGDFDGYLHWLDRDSGKFVARERPGGARISQAPVATADGRVFVVDDDGRVAAFRSGGTSGR